MFKYDHTHVTVNREKILRKVMVRMGRYSVTARKLQNSQAGGGQRHRQRPFVTSIRIDVDQAFLGDGNQTRGVTCRSCLFVCHTSGVLC
jgi:hypothetical protein